MHSSNTYHLTWVSLTLGLGYLFTGGYLFTTLQQSAAAAPYIGQGVSSHAAPSDVLHGVCPLSPPAPMQPPLLRHGFALLCCRPNLGRGVAPPGHHS